MTDPHDGMEPSSESFEALLENFEAAHGDDIRVGDKIQGKIIAIETDSIFVDLGAKIDGMVDKSELLDPEGNLTLQQGDSVELYVASVQESEIRLSKSVSAEAGLALLRQAREESLPVEGKVKAVVKGGFHVDLSGRRAFCPISQMDMAFVENPEDYVGTEGRFLITRLEDRGRNIVVSRRVLLEKDVKEAAGVFLADLKPGQVHEATVVRTAPFGVFAALFPGVEGLVHVSEMSWSRMENPEAFAKPGDKIQVRVLSMEPGKKQGELKISLSAKQVEQNPWDADDFSIRAGDRRTGTVTRLAGFGAFVELSPGVEGLVHISEMSYRKHVVKPEEVVKPGQEIEVKVKEVDSKSRRISLSMREAEGDPWMEAAEKFPKGATVEGTLEKKEGFGLFVSVAPGVTGLLPMSVINRSGAGKQMDRLKPGDKVTVTVTEVDTARRRMSLSPGTGAEESDWKKFTGASSGGTESLLAEKLKAALEKKSG